MKIYRIRLYAKINGVIVFEDCEEHFYKDIDIAQQWYDEYIKDRDIYVDDIDEIEVI